MSRRSERGMQPAVANFGTRFREALRDAALTALIAFGLFLPLVGFQTVTDIRDVLTVTTRWPLLFGLVGSIAAVRFVYAMVLAPRFERGARLIPQRAASAA